MIWIASFPRSGNTFLRNVLYEVYGIESSTYHQDPTRKLDRNYTSYQAIKTHIRPDLIRPNLGQRKVVYLVRDGRDALVSIAHHRKSIVEPGTDFYVNLVEAILARGGSYFGGWSTNVSEWMDRAHLIIRFEDLIKDPIKEIEKMRDIIDLPPPQRDKLPSFQQLKYGKPKYGGGKGKSFSQSKTQLHFRKGQIGGWKEEMPAELEELFCAYHSDVMDSLGYVIDRPTTPKPKKKVLIEVSKLFTKDDDGIKRYIAELIEHLPFLIHNRADWQIDLYHEKQIQPLHEINTILQDRGISNFHKKNIIEEAIEDQHGSLVYETILLQIKHNLRANLPSWLHRPLRHIYTVGPFRTILRKIRHKVILKKIESFQLEFANQLNGYDIIHVPLPQHMHLVNKTQSHIVVTVHDITHALFPDMHTAANVQLSEDGFQALKKRKADVIAISKATKDDIIKSYHIPQEQIHLVPQAANHGRFNNNKAYDWPAIRDLYNIPDAPYFLCLSTIEPRKNLLHTITAFNLLNSQYKNIHLVISGKKGWKSDTLLANVGEMPSIHFTGFVDDDHITAIYQNARAFCYISLYEGFGLPILEAMTCGTPVIYGNNSAMPEVAGDGGLPADPYDVENIATQMERLLVDDELHTRLSEAAFKHAMKFSWLKTAMQTLQVYETIINRQ